MNGRLRFMAVLAALTGFVTAGEAQTGLYVQLDMGLSVAPPLTVEGTDNDWGTMCDLIINPLGLEVTDQCDDPPPPTFWTNSFGSTTDIQSGLAVGYDLGPIRIEGEYVHRMSSYTDRSDIKIFDDVTIDKQEQEIELAIGRVEDLRSHHVFANVYYDFGAATAKWTPYLGAGVGIGRSALDYGTVWKRNDDPARIATFEDPTLRAKLAGTTTIGDARLTDVVVGLQLLGGLDYRLRDPVTLGIKVRWASFGKFMSDPVLWDQLRSHESSVGRGEAVVYRIATDDTGFWGVSLNLRCWF